MRGSLLRQAVGQIRADACATFAGVPGLFEPKDWSKLGQAAIERCTGLLNNVTISEPSSQTVRDLDEMSDVLCQVLDAAEFCRNVHSNASWRDAAERTCVELSGFVHELNTNFTLYTALKNAIASSKTMTTSSSWDSETGMVARMLLRDFERYGVHLEGTTKDRMTQLVAQHQIVGYEFGHNAADPKQCGQLTIQGAAARRVSQLPSALQNEFSTAGAGILTARGQSSTLFGIMGFSNEESLRKAAYDLYNNTPSNNRDILARLLEIRREIAGIMGYPSYAAYQLHGASLAGDPSAVTEFLQRLSKDSNDKAAAEIQELMGRNWAAKGGLPHLDLDGKPTKHAGHLAAWDKDWLINKAVNSSKEMEHFNILNNRMFTLNGCLAAMNEIFSKTMGVVLHEVEPQRNEIWAHGVRKIMVENDSDGFLGCIYFDPYKRSRKFPGAAHFTLRCGREKSGGSGSGTYVTYQTPVVAVVTNFHSLDSTLSFSEVETLFHEFGHALNSVLSRTRFQHLSGTYVFPGSSFF